MTTTAGGGEPFSLGVIVEGHGDELAVPIVIRRIAGRVDPTRRVGIKTLRVPRNLVVKEGQLERYVELASRQIRTSGAILVVLDADDDCAATLGRDLLGRCVAARGDRQHAVVFAVKEFECWFLAAASSIAGHRGLPDDLESPSEPENFQGAKGWLKRKRTDGRSYGETIDQPALAQVFDLDAARANAPSFDKLWRDVERLMNVSP